MRPCDWQSTSPLQSSYFADNPQLSQAPSVIKWCWLLSCLMERDAPSCAEWVLCFQNVTLSASGGSEQYRLTERPVIITVNHNLQDTTAYTKYTRHFKTKYDNKLKCGSHSYNMLFVAPYSGIAGLVTLHIDLQAPGPTQNTILSCWNEPDQYSGYDYPYSSQVERQIPCLCDVKYQAWKS